MNRKGQLKKVAQATRSAMRFTQLVGIRLERRKFLLLCSPASLWQENITFMGQKPQTPLKSFFRLSQLTRM